MPFSPIRSGSRLSSASEVLQLADLRLVAAEGEYANLAHPEAMGWPRLLWQEGEGKKHDRPF